MSVAFPPSSAEYVGSSWQHTRCPVRANYDTALACPNSRATLRRLNRRIYAIFGGMVGQIQVFNFRTRLAAMKNRHTQPLFKEVMLRRCLSKESPPRRY